jgi:dUTP pyrophosphatase
MIIPGRTALSRKAITRLLSPKQQVQPCGVDLTLKRILTWTTSGVIDFTNTRRKTADTAELPFQLLPTSTQTSPHDRSTDFVELPHGSYLVEFNETVEMPLDLMGQIFVRSSLFRSGALVHAGVMDSGYNGVVGAMLQVVNPQGLRLFRDAKVAQMVFHQMSEEVEGYSGVYQGRTSL